MPPTTCQGNLLRRPQKIVCKRQSITVWILKIKSRMIINIQDKGASIMQSAPQDLLKQYVQSQHFSSTTEIMDAMKRLFRETFFFSDLCDGFVVWRKHPAKHGFLEFWTVVHVSSSSLG